MSSFVICNFSLILKKFDKISNKCAAIAIRENIEESFNVGFWILDFGKRKLSPNTPKIRHRSSQKRPKKLLETQAAEQILREKFVKILRGHFNYSLSITR